MQLTMRVGAAIGIVVLAGCSQTSTQDTNAADNGTGMTVNEAAPSTDVNAQSDTLGNQLNQLNESDSEAANAVENSSADQ